MWVQLCPASVDLYTPSPWDEAVFRIGDSPMPTTITFGSDGATAMAPTAALPKSSSDTGSQDAPAFTVFHTPPVVPM